MEYWDRHRLKRVLQQRQFAGRTRRLGDTLRGLVQKRILPRQENLSALGRAWGALLPQELQEHSCLDDFRRGRLKVLVDTSAHLYELTLLLQGGLTDQLREQCPGIGLNEVKLVRGLWYQMNGDGNKICRFGKI